jgi:hypothetical protein
MEIARKVTYVGMCGSAGARCDDTWPTDLYYPGGVYSRSAYLKSKPKCKPKQAQAQAQADPQNGVVQPSQTRPGQSVVGQHEQAIQRQDGNEEKRIHDMLF